MRWHQRKDGTRFWANGQMLALRDGEGQLRGFAKILRDDTPRKTMEDALIQTRKQLQSALDVGRIGTWAWDIPNNRVVADSNLAGFFGVSPEDARGGPIEQYLAVVHPEDIETLSAAIHEALQSGSAFMSDYRILGKDRRELWVEARGQIERDSSGNPLYLNGVMLDISERKRAEDAFRRSKSTHAASGGAFCSCEFMAQTA